MTKDKVCATCFHWNPVDRTCRCFAGDNYCEETHAHDGCNDWLEDPFSPEGSE